MPDAPLRQLSDVVTKPYTVYDLGGETFTGSYLEGLKGIEIYNGSVVATPPSQGGPPPRAAGAEALGLVLSDCHGAYVHDLTISAPPALKLQELLNNLGSDDLTMEDLHLVGGSCAGQLHVGQSSYDTAGTPKRWVARRIVCEGNQLWGQYPQGHCTYINTRPDVNMSAVIEDCVFIQDSGAGHVHKIGSTANNPQFEGTNGLFTRRCRIVCAPGPDKRAMPIVVQGAGTKNISFEDIVCEMVHSPISKQMGWELTPNLMHVITVVQGARATMSKVTFPRGALQFVEKQNPWYMALFGAQWSTKKEVAPQDYGGLRWYAPNPV